MVWLHFSIEPKEMTVANEDAM